MWHYPSHNPHALCKVSLKPYQMPEPMEGQVEKKIHWVTVHVTWGQNALGHIMEQYNG